MDLQNEGARTMDGVVALQQLSLQGQLLLVRGNAQLRVNPRFDIVNGLDRDPVRVDLL